MIVTVKQGALHGEKKATILNEKPYIRFLGIPYGQPPVGSLRFQAPRPSEKWEGVYDATYEKQCCLQKSPAFQFIIGSEDCLYLNVYMPEVSLPTKELKAVMVFFYGGGFCHGSGTHKVYGPDYLIERGVILVTVNYRVQVLGFLNLGIPECPGNAGLKDQVLALKWVQENIVNFGGDPANVTIFGESSGASSVFYHIISPLSKGLFHKAIAQSGSCLSPWAFYPEPTEVAFSIGQKLGFKGFDKLQLLHYLRNQPAKKLTKAGHQYRESLMYTEKRSPIFAPSIEAIKEGAILPEHPRVLLATAPPVPMICGCNDAEGVFGIGMMSEEKLQAIDEYVTLVLKKNFIIDHDNLHNIASQVKQLYFTDNQNRKEKLHSLANLLTDIFFYYFEESIETASKSCFPPYIYEFTHAGGQNSMKKIAMMRAKCGFKGACHGDELDYLFFRKFKWAANQKLDPTDLKVIENMCSMWTNFAKTGNPGISVWRPNTSSQPCYLKIGTDSLEPISGTVHGPRRQLLKNVLHGCEMRIFSL